jgi:serine/threonine protein kinase
VAIRRPKATAGYNDAAPITSHNPRRAMPPNDAEPTESLPAANLAGDGTRTADPAATRSSSDGDPVLVPTSVRLPGYTVLGELGRGAMGIVYKAHDDRLGRIIAIKMILAGGHAGTVARERFQREAKAVAALNHPNVVQIYDVGEADGLPYLALEYVPGGTLYDLASAGPLPAHQAAELVAAVAGAVHAAHAAGIVHRDLKPANILRTPDGTPKVADFGLAKWADSETGPTGTSHVLGTPAYMAPEQCGEGRPPVGPATDVYGLGGILYHLLTGRPPFTGPTPMAVIRQVVDRPPTPPRQVRPDVPAGIEAVCLTCLEKDPARRYPSAAAVADELNRFLAGEPVRAKPPHTRRSRRWAWWAVGGVAAALWIGLIGLLLLVFVLFPIQPVKPPPPVEPEELALANKDQRPAGNPEPDPPKLPNWDAEGLYSRVEPAVVQIRADRTGGAVGTGTGFVCQEPGLVVTGARVLGMHVEAAPPPGRIEVVVNSGTPAAANRIARILSVDRANDLAYLQVNPAGLPAPLQVRTTAGLAERETLYVFGFLLKHGRRMFMSETSVRAVLTDEQGYVTAIRTTAPVSPDSHGAPLTDATGRVVGLLRGTTEPGGGFALVASGDLLLHLLRERARWLRPGQAVTANGKVTQPVVLRVADPLNRLAGVKLEVATGPSKAPPETGPWRAFPLVPRPDDPAGPGEDRDFVGTIELPPLPAGQVYWVRPRLTNTAGGDRAEAARVLRGGTLPVEARAVELPAGWKAGDASTVRYQSSATIHEEADGHGAAGKTLRLDADLTETVEPRPPDGATVRLRVTRFQPSADGITEAVIREAQTGAVGQELSAAVGPDGALLATPEVGPLQLAGAAGPLARGLMVDLAGELHGLTVPRPGKRLEPGDTWTREATGPRAAGSPLGRAAYRYEYLGTRTRDARTEAVVRLEVGPLPATGTAPLSGRGVALIDLASGMPTLVHLTYEYNLGLRVAQKGVMNRVSARRTATLRRVAGTEAPPGPADPDLLPDQPIPFGPTP